MKKQYYIEVDPKEELPDIEDTYFIKINGVKGRAEFHKYEKTPEHMIIKPNTWTKDDRNGYEYEVIPGSWLKPVYPPSDEEQQIIKNDLECIYDDFSELLHLHSCEEEGIQSGQPSANQWRLAVEDARNSLATLMSLIESAPPKVGTETSQKEE